MSIVIMVGAELISISDRGEVLDVTQVFDEPVDPVPLDVVRRVIDESLDRQRIVDAPALRWSWSRVHQTAPAPPTASPPATVFDADRPVALLAEVRRAVVDEVTRELVGIRDHEGDPMFGGEAARERAEEVATRALHRVPWVTASSPPSENAEPSRPAGSAGLYRRRPGRSMEAIRWTGDNWGEVGAWLHARDVASATLSDDRTIKVVDEDCVFTVHVGSWVVVPEVGELMTMRESRFVDLYEPVTVETIPEMISRLPTLDQIRETVMGSVNPAIEAAAALRLDTTSKPEFISISSDAAMVEACARVAHAVYRDAYSGEDVMLEWEDLFEGERAVVRGSARAALSGTTPREWHAKWRADKEVDGWAYGRVRDETRKTHPNMVEYDHLPTGQRMLDSLFVTACRATQSAIEELYSPVLKVTGSVTQEQFDDFKKKMQVSATELKGDR